MERQVQNPGCMSKVVMGDASGCVLCVEHMACTKLSPGLRDMLIAYRDVWKRHHRAIVHLDFISTAGRNPWNDGFAYAGMLAWLTAQQLFSLASWPKEICVLKGICFREADDQERKGVKELQPWLKY